MESLLAAVENLVAHVESVKPAKEELYPFPFPDADGNPIYENKYIPVYVVSDDWQNDFEIREVRITELCKKAGIEPCYLQFTPHPAHLYAEFAGQPTIANRDFWLHRMNVVKARASVLVQAGEPAAMLKPPADGPFGFDGFRWRGTEHGGLTKRAVKLVSAIWPAAEHICDLQDAIEAVYGDDPPPDDGIGGARKDANNFFHKRRIPLLVKASQLTQRVSIVAAEPQKVTSSAPKKAKQSKKTANRR